MNMRVTEVRRGSGTSPTLVEHTDTARDGQSTGLGVRPTIGHHRQKPAAVQTATDGNSGRTSASADQRMGVRAASLGT